MKDCKDVVFSTRYWTFRESYEFVPNGAENKGGASTSYFMDVVGQATPSAAVRAS